MVPGSFFPPAVVEQAAAQLTPATVVGGAAALGGLALLALNFKAALRFIGVVGVELTILNRALRQAAFLPSAAGGQGWGRDGMARACRVLHGEVLCSAVLCFRMRG